MLKKFTTYVLAFTASALSAQSLPADISFSNNAWTKNNTAISFSGNTCTIPGDPSNIRKIYLDVPVASTYSDVYFVAEVKLDNMVYGVQDFERPKFKVYQGGTSTAILAYNLSSTNFPMGNFYLTGMPVNRYNKMGLTSLRLEFSIQKCAGTMTITNPQLLSTPPAMTFEYPFSVPANPAYSLNIDTNQKHSFDNNLLSTNSHFKFLQSYGANWGSPEVDTIFNKWFLQKNFRFPGGTVGNTYDWTTDRYYDPATYTFLQSNTGVVTAYNSGFTFHYNDYKNTVIAKNATATEMYDVTAMPVQSLANRYQSRLNDGLNVKWIEMGNETYFPENQVGNITDVNAYATYTQNLTAALKQVNPNIKTAINIDNSNYTSGSWNDVLSGYNYFDAAVIHNYNNVNTFIYSGSSIYSMLNTYRITRNRIDSFKVNFPGKDLLFTEWGILSEGIPCNFIQTLASADAFLATEKGNAEGLVKQAGIHMLWHSNTYNESTLCYKDETTGQMGLTANGVMYASLFDTFLNNQVFNADVTGPELTSNLSGLYAKAIDTGTEYKVFIVNKLSVSSNFSLNINSSNYSGNYTLKSFHEDVHNQLTVPYTDKNAPWTVTSGINTTGTFSIPAFSVSVLTLTRPTNLCESASINNMVSNANFECGYNTDWTASLKTGVTAIVSDGASSSYSGLSSAKIELKKLTTKKLFSDLQYINKGFSANLKNKTLTINCMAKSLAAGKFQLQIVCKDLNGIALPAITSGTFTTGTSYAPYSFSTNITYDTSEISVRILAGNQLGTYFFDNFSTTLANYAPQAIAPAPDVANEPESGQDNLLVLSPNPASDYVRINQLNRIQTVTIKNMNGQTVKSLQTNDNLIPVYDLARGIYAVVIQTEDQKLYTEKLIIK